LQSNSESAESSQRGQEDGQVTNELPEEPHETFQNREKKLVSHHVGDMDAPSNSDETFNSSFQDEEERVKPDTPSKIPKEINS